MGTTVRHLALIIAAVILGITTVSTARNERNNSDSGRSMTNAAAAVQNQEGIARTERSSQGPAREAASLQRSSSAERGSRESEAPRTSVRESQTRTSSSKTATTSSVDRSAAVRREPARREQNSFTQNVPRVSSSSRAVQRSVEISQPQAAGRGNATSSIGRSDVSTSIGRSGAATSIARADAATSIARSTVTTSAARSGATTSVARAEAPSSIARSDARTSVAQSLAPTSIARADVPVSIAQSGSTSADRAYSAPAARAPVVRWAETAKPSGRESARNVIFKAPEKSSEVKIARGNADDHGTARGAVSIERDRIISADDVGRSDKPNVVVSRDLTKPTVLPQRGSIAALTNKDRDAGNHTDQKSASPTKVDRERTVTAAQVKRPAKIVTSAQRESREYVRPIIEPAGRDGRRYDGGRTIAPAAMRDGGHSINRPMVNNASYHPPMHREGPTVHRDGFYDRGRTWHHGRYWTPHYDRPRDHHNSFYFGFNFYYPRYHYCAWAPIVYNPVYTPIWDPVLVYEPDVVVYSSSSSYIASSVVTWPAYRRTVFYACGPSYTVSYVYPQYFNRYVFYSVGGYWPCYSYPRYYSYGCHPYVWYGAAPTAYIVPETTNVYTYQLPEPLVPGSVVAGVQVPDYDGLKRAAQNVTTQAAAEPPVQPSEATEADKFFDDGVKAFAAKDYAGAMEKFRSGVRAAPEDQVMPFAYAQALFAMNEYEQAAAVIVTALADMAPQQQEVYYPRGLYTDETVLQEQVRNLERAVSMNPTNSDMQLLLGYHLLGIGRLNEAAGPLESAKRNARTAGPAEALMVLLEKARGKN